MNSITVIYPEILIMPMGKLEIPEVGEIIEEAVKNILKNHNRETLRDLHKIKSLSEMINEIESEAEGLYKKYEREAIREYIKRRELSDKNIFEVIDRMLENSIFTSIPNTRRSRAGSTSQLILVRVLNEIGIPCEISRIKFKGYRPDIIVPSNKVFKLDPNKCFVIAVKRTLRERWAEDIDIFKFRNSGFVLIKPDPDFTLAKARDMFERGMKRVYIPEELYEPYRSDLEKFGIFKNISELPKDLIIFLSESK
ncbi:MAG: type II restriction endonuclease [Archaeoglobales archaeon]|nr:type II restriction endonuclease [Archaeoglobales archaeon]